jgi:hypothetical protein
VFKKERKQMYPDNEPDLVQPQSLTESSKDKLRQYVQRIETLEAEKKQSMAW